MSKICLWLSSDRWSTRKPAIAIPAPCPTLECDHPRHMAFLPDGIQWLPGYTAVRAGVHSDSQIAVLLLARPSKSNAFNAAMWEEFPRAVRQLGGDDRARVVRQRGRPPGRAAAAAARPSPPSLPQVVIAAEGRNFTAGLDLGYLQQTFMGHSDGPAACPARTRQALLARIKAMQVPPRLHACCSTPCAVQRAAAPSTSMPHPPWWLAGSCTLWLHPPAGREVTQPCGP